MNSLRKLRDMVRRKPLTAEELAARTEANVLHEQMLQDRSSQKTRIAQIYRSRGR